MDETVIDNEVVSDSESIICERIHENALEEKALLRLDEGSLEYINLKHRFFLCLGSLAERCSVVVIRRMVPCSSAMSRAQVMAFKLFEKAVAEKNGGDPNVKLGWYGTSADGIFRILRSGFDYGALPIGEFRHGLCIYGDCSVANCILQCATDANGLKHLVLCRVILGKTEQVLPGSTRCGPSSDQFDSGVDCNQQPKKYIVWNSDVKTRVLPLYFLSVKLHPISQERSKDDLRRPCSPWVSFTELISALSKCFSSSDVCLIKRFHIRYMERKISRLQLVAHLRQIVGDEILISVIRNFQNKRKMSVVNTCAKSGDNKLLPRLRKPTCRTRLGELCVDMNHQDLKHMYKYKYTFNSILFPFPKLPGSISQRKHGQSMEAVLIAPAVPRRPLPKQAQRPLPPPAVPPSVGEQHPAEPKAEEPHRERHVGVGPRSHARGQRQLEQKEPQQSNVEVTVPAPTARGKQQLQLQQDQ